MKNQDFAGKGALRAERSLALVGCLQLPCVVMSVKRKSSYWMIPSLTTAASKNCILLL